MQWRDFKSQYYIFFLSYIKHHFDHVPHRKPKRVFCLKCIPNGNQCVCLPCLCVCACPFMCGRAARTGDFLCRGRERLGHFIFSCVHCQKGQRSKVRAIGEFRAACRQIGFQAWGKGRGSPRGIGAYACVCVRVCMYTCRCCERACVCACAGPACAKIRVYVWACSGSPFFKTSFCSFSAQSIWNFLLMFTAL